MRNVVAHEGTLHLDFEPDFKYYIRFAYRDRELLYMRLDHFYNFIIIGYLNFFSALEHICFQHFKNEITNNMEIISRSLYLTSRSIK